jgi:hypothetical protein
MKMIDQGWWHSIGVGMQEMRVLGYRFITGG